MRSTPLLLACFLVVGCSARKPPTPTIAPPLEPLAARTVPGGTLRVLEVATTSSPERLVVQGGGGQVLVLPVYVYVFEHPTEGLVLIDAGFPRRTASDVRVYPGKRMAKLLSLQMEPGRAAADRLPEIGHRPEDVKHVVITHMHPDHVGGIEDFPGATLWVTEPEWAAREHGGPLGKPDTSPFAGHASVRIVPLAPSAIRPFAESADLFGDGSLVVLRTPGHTPGHVSVLLSLPDQTFLLTGDAAWTDVHWQGPELKSGLVRSLLEDDWKANWVSQSWIAAFAAANPQVVIVAGHEPANRERLLAWPEAYGSPTPTEAAE